MNKTFKILLHAWGVKLQSRNVGFACFSMASRISGVPPQTADVTNILSPAIHYLIILRYTKNSGSNVYYLLLNTNLKGALDKYNTHLFISNSIQDFKLNQYQNFQLLLPMRFHFMRYFVNSIISRVSNRLLFCVIIEVNFEE